MLPIQAPSQKSFLFFILSLLHSCTFRIWSLIAMATSDFSCSLGPVLSLSNQNKTFVKIPSGSTYSTHYDELTLTLKRDRERTTARERFLQAIRLYSKKEKKMRKRRAFKWQYNMHSDLKRRQRERDNLVPASTFCLLLYHSLPLTVCG